MAGKQITMSKVKQILQQIDHGLSQREISRRLCVDRKTVALYLQKMKLLSLTTQQILSLPDIEAEALFKADVPIVDDKEEYKYLESLFPYFKKEIKKHRVTKLTLWQEYRSKSPNGYSYSQMCHHYYQWLKRDSVSMHMEHEYGEELYIDFTGRKIAYYNTVSKRMVKEEVLVCMLGGSNYFYVEAMHSQKMEDYISGVSNSINFFGGVPKTLILDNLKSGVILASKHQATINDSFLSMANHYGAIVDPTRPYSPKDKPLVEGAVNLTYNRVFSPLRNASFDSLTSLNKAINELVAKANSINFQSRDYSRKDLFEKHEKQTLKPITMRPYEPTKSYKLKVNTKYHVYFSKDKHSYSVPYIHVGKRVKAVVTKNTISFYYNYVQIATHLRSSIVGKCSTKPEHLHPHHRYVKEWEPSVAYEWASKIDPSVEEYLVNMLSGDTYYHKARKMYEGVVSISKKYGNTRLINACKRALSYNAYDYTTLKNIIANNLDLLDCEKGLPKKKIPLHSNIRGANYYQ